MNMKLEVFPAGAKIPSREALEERSHKEALVETATENTAQRGIEIVDQKLKTEEAGIAARDANITKRIQSLLVDTAKATPSFAASMFNGYIGETFRSLTNFRAGETELEREERLHAKAQQPSLKEKITQWSENRKREAEQTAEDKRKLAEDMERDRQAFGISLAKDFARRHGKTYTPEQEERVGKKLLEQKEIAELAELKANAEPGDAVAVLKGTLKGLRAFSKYFTVEFAESNTAIDRALRTEKEQREFEEAEDIRSGKVRDDNGEKIRGLPREMGGTVHALEDALGGKGIGKMLANVGAIDVNPFKKETDYYAQGAEDFVPETPEASLLRQLLPTVFFIKDSVTIRNIEIQIEAAEKAQQAKQRIARAWDTFTGTLNTVRESAMLAANLHEDSSVRDSLRSALRAKEEVLHIRPEARKESTPLNVLTETLRSKGEIRQQLNLRGAGGYDFVVQKDADGKFAIGLMSSGTTSTLETVIGSSADDAAAIFLNLKNDFARSGEALTRSEALRRIANAVKEQRPQESLAA